MSGSPPRKLVVKHTFLEFEEKADKGTQGRARSFTDGAIMNLDRVQGEAWNSSNEAGPEKLPQQEMINPELGSSCPELSEIIERDEEDMHSVEAAAAERKAQLKEDQSRLLAIMNARPTPAASSAASAAAAASQCSARAKAPPAQQIPAPMLPNYSFPATWFMQLMNAASAATARPHRVVETPTPPGLAPAKAHPFAAATQPQTRNQERKATPTTLSLSDSIVSSSPSTDNFTTVMLRNLPNQYTRSMLVEMLEKEGFASKFNFVYLPIDFKTHAGLGYAFVDLTTPAEAARACAHFEGFCRWAVQSEKICSVSWSHPEQQGYAAHVERYRNSPVMHSSIADEWKPALFRAGARVPFPPPTRKLRMPRVKDLDSQCNNGK